jgi:hypothetical protein
MSMRDLAKVDKIFGNQIRNLMTKSAAGAVVSLEEIESLAVIARSMMQMKAFKWKRAAEIRKHPFVGSQPMSDEELLEKAAIESPGDDDDDPREE